MNKKPLKNNLNGNISILVIFVLLASSLIGILSTNFIRDLFNYNNTISNHYKGYYLSKAGLELSLTEISNNGIGFENKVNTGDDIILSNFDCANNCNFLTEIKGTSNYISNSIQAQSGCNSPIILNTGESIIIPLFKQINTGSNFEKLTTTLQYQNIAQYMTNINLENITANRELSIGIFIISGDQLLENGLFIQTGSTNNNNIINSFLQSFINYASNIEIGGNTLNNLYIDNNSSLKSFLIFGNSMENNDISFCIKISPNLNPYQEITFPTQSFYIKSIANINTSSIGLEALLKQAIPQFLIHTYLDL
ncbi:hypothetical protein K9M48_02770 [Candidatus Gracilibacteria bacterium]|nr:hypothetical protein [Candidatus Gracilibacteria bacterium]